VRRKPPFTQLQVHDAESWHARSSSGPRQLARSDRTRASARAEYNDVYMRQQARKSVAHSAISGDRRLKCS
jgi:hypothetical protein